VSEWEQASGAISAKDVGSETLMGVKQGRAIGVIRKELEWGNCGRAPKF